MKEQNGYERKQKWKVRHVDCMPTRITEITSYLSKTHNWKSPGIDQIHNSRFKLSQLLTDTFQNLQCNNRVTGEGT